MPQYALGLDFGTSSVRALIVDCADGAEMGSGVEEYASGVDGVLLDPQEPDLARQEPDDYIFSMMAAIDIALKAAGEQFDRKQIVGIGVDTTGSTPMPVRGSGLPRAGEEKHRGNPSMKAWLWKDHTSHAEAEEITDLARRQGRPYLARCGGSYSSEWFWAKALRAVRDEPTLFDDPETSWMELCDFIPSFLCAPHREPLRHSICAAGHKAMYSDDWGGLPDREFLGALDPRLAILRDRLYDRAYPSDQAAGRLGHSEAFDLSPKIPVAVGLLDAHAGAVGSGVAPGRMVKILGTSTCDILVGGPETPNIEGVSGVVEGSVLPGMVGIEAGQSAVGDIFAWWSRVCGRSQEELTADAMGLRPGQSGLLALDWNNGNRNILADPLLRGLLIGQTLQTTAPEIYRALIEATVFGALKIIRRIEDSGVAIEDLVACGGIAEKSPLVMQIYADVLNRPIRLSRCSQAPALGAAIFGSVVGGAHPDVPTAQATMTGFKDLEYQPDPGSAEVYRRLFALYESLHDAFGLPIRADLSPVMKQLGAIRRQ